MKQLLTFLVILFAAGFSCKALAMDAYDVSAVGEFSVAAEPVEVEEADSEFTVPQFLFSGSLVRRTADFMANELGFPPIHGQPLPGVLISLLLGAAFGAARRLRSRRDATDSESTAVDALPQAGRLLRMNVLFLNPPQTIHAISPGPDLFCLRE